MTRLACPVCGRLDALTSTGSITAERRADRVVLIWADAPEPDDLYCWACVSDLKADRLVEANEAATP